MFKAIAILVLLAVQVFAIDLQIEPQQRFWITWNGTQSCQIESLLLPTTREELMALVQEAGRLGKKVKVLGAGHSLNAIALPEKEGWIVSLEAYDRVLEVDAGNQTVTVQGGATLKQINEALRQHGLALENLGSISDQTIGGVIQTGTHGTGGNYGPLHTQILSMTAINGKGECKTLSPALSPLEFRAYQCGLGTLGIIDTAILRTVPVHLLLERTYAAEWPALLDQIDGLVQENDHFRFYWFPYCNRVGVWTANPTNREVKALPKDSSPFSRLIEEVSKEREDTTILTIEDVLELGPDDPAILERVNRAFFEADYGVVAQRSDWPDRIFNVDCSAHVHCTAIEVAFPIRYTKPYLLELQKLVEEHHFPVHGGVEVRFVRADPALLSLTYSEHPEDLFCFVSIVSIRPNNRPISSCQTFFQAAQKLAETYQGRIHWGKMGTFDPTYLKKAYPQWELFRKIQKQEDPSGIFINEFTGKILERSSNPPGARMNEKMTTIGVAGVTIPGAVDCIQKINRSSPLYFANNEHPNVILYQPNFGVLQSALQNGDWPKVLLELSKSVEALADMGADFAIVPANTVHKVILELQKQSSIPILNMLEIVSDVCKEQKIKKIGIMGTTWTMSGHLYKDAMEANGIEEMIPSEEEQQIIHKAIFSEIISTGNARPATLAALLDVVESLKQKGCDGIALACTELTLVLNEANCGIPIIDTTNALAKAALKKAAE